MGGDNPWVSGMFFKAVVNLVLIFGSETWVMTPPTWDRPWGGGGGGSVQVGQMDYRESAPEDYGQKLGVNPIGGCNS